jgi:hypothetical protein
VCFFKELEILLLILVGIVFDKPKLPLGFYSREVELRELFLLHLDASAHFRAVLERLAQKRLHDVTAFPAWED